MRLAAAVEGMAVFTGVFVRERLLPLSTIAVWHTGAGDADERPLQEQSE